MSLKKMLAIFALVFLPLAVACGPNETAETDDSDASDTATTTSEQEQPGTEQPGDLNPVEAQMAIDDVTLGHSTNPDNTIPVDQQGDDFAPGETVHLSMEVGDTPAGSLVKVVWFGPGETRINEETKTVATGDKYLTFNSGDTASWAKGDYRAEVWIGDEKVNQQQYQIVDKEEAGR
ncbi:MAG TPA: hypothetical protein VFR31_12055 [Thermoanaerobaculia bacterium]|nr:hypothetical protein [Thermoanaerobaculia bacterium]